MALSQNLAHEMALLSTVFARTGSIVSRTSTLASTRRFSRRAGGRLFPPGVN